MYWQVFVFYWHIWSTYSPKILFCKKCEKKTIFYQVPKLHSGVYFPQKWKWNISKIYLKFEAYFIIFVTKHLILGSRFMKLKTWDRHFPFFFLQFWISCLCKILAKIVLKPLRYIFQNLLLICHCILSEIWFMGLGILVLNPPKTLNR